MKNVIFIAPPASGKGTQSEILVRDYGYEHISTGDLLRTKQNDGSDLGNYISRLLSEGKLVDDEIVTELLKEKLSSINGPFILDGYPRTINQAGVLDNLLDELGLNIGAVIYLNVSGDIAMKRALGRVTCPECNKIYNKYFDDMKPSVDGMCDECAVPLKGRSDDNEESFKIRFDTYLKNTKPLLDYYEEKELLVVINKVNNPQETHEEVKKVISNGNYKIRRRNS